MKICVVIVLYIVFILLHVYVLHHNIEYLISVSWTSFVIVVVTIVCDYYVCHIMLYVLCVLSRCHVYFCTPVMICVLYVWCQEKSKMGLVCFPFYFFFKKEVSGRVVS